MYIKSLFIFYARSILQSYIERYIWIILKSFICISNVSFHKSFKSFLLPPHIFPRFNIYTIEIQWRSNAYERNSDSLHSLRVNMPFQYAGQHLRVVGKCSFYASICPNAIQWPISSCAACPGSEALASINYKLCGMSRFLGSLFFISISLGSTTN